jgi:methanethiol S-methyltransferase
MKDHILIALAWIIFCVLHSLLASGSFKKYLEKKNNKFFTGFRLWYTLFAFLSFSAILLYQLFTPSPFVFLPSNFTRIAGIVIALPGIAIMSSAIIKYFSRLSGMYWLLHNDTKNILQRSGIHKYVRHPLYLGTFLFIWGLFIFLPKLSLLIADSIITIYTLIGIRFEEKKLLAEFGKDYKKYKEEVPMIIPKTMKR